MIKIIIKEGENIERALKRYKRKYRNVKIKEQINERKQFTKKSEANRKKIEKAKHKERFLRSKEL